MNVSGVQGGQTSVPQTQSVDNKRLALQAALLRKSLDAQQEQSVELSRQMEGKGQVIDMRV